MLSHPTYIYIYIYRHIYIYIYSGPTKTHPRMEPPSVHRCMRLPLGIQYDMIYLIYSIILYYIIPYHTIPYYTILYYGYDYTAHDESLRRLAAAFARSAKICASDGYTLVNKLYIYIYICRDDTKEREREREMY